MLSPMRPVGLPPATPPIRRTAPQGGAVARPAAVQPQASASNVLADLASAIGRAFKALFAAIARLFATKPAGTPAVAPALPSGVLPAPPPPPLVPPPPPPPPPPPVVGAPGSPVPAGLAPANATNHDKKIFAHYMPWFGDAPDYQHWNFRDHDPRKLDAQGLPDLATAHHPLIGPYSSNDEAVIGYHMLLMKAAGFDGTVVNWYGTGSYTDEVTHKMLDKAEQWGARYGFDFSLSLMPDAGPYKDLPNDQQVARLTADMKTVVNQYGASSRYQHLDGKPVAYFFPKPDPAHPGQTAITANEWAQVKANVGTPFDLVLEHTNEDMAGVSDGGFGWISLGQNANDWNPRYLDWLYPAFANQRKQGRDMPVQVGVTYAGFNDVGVYGWTNDPANTRLMNREVDGRSVIDLTWQKLDQYNAAHPDTAVNWVQTATWNDWNEGSEIEPSVELGFSTLAKVAGHNAEFTGKTPPPQEAFDFALKYLQLRRSGKTDADLGLAIAAFARADYTGALARLPR